MFVVDNIAYAETPMSLRKIIDVKTLDDMMMILTFESNEKRLYDANALLAFPAFKKLENPSVFHHPVIDHGIVTWDNGAIDIAPETMYANSYSYTDKPTSTIEFE